MADPSPGRGTSVTILVNPRCPHCLQALDHLTDWCVDARVPVAGVDLWRHPEAAEPLTSEHSPTLVFAGGRERVHVGMPTHEEFLRLVRG